MINATQVPWLTIGSRNLTNSGYAQRSLRKHSLAESNRIPKRANANSSLLLPTKHPKTQSCTARMPCTSICQSSSFQKTGLPSHANIGRACFDHSSIVSSISIKCAMQKSTMSTFLPKGGILAVNYLVKTSRLDDTSMSYILELYSTFPSGDKML